jgi:hypothetical protein
MPTQLAGGALLVNGWISITPPLAINQTSLDIGKSV